MRRWRSGCMPMVVPHKVRDRLLANSWAGAGDARWPESSQSFPSSHRLPKTENGAARTSGCRRRQPANSMGRRQFCQLRRRPHAKPVSGQSAPLAIPDKCIGDICFGFWSENNFEVAHKAPRRARASDQGTACVVPERSAFFRRRISSPQALPMVASSSPSRLSRSAITRAERSSGASANA